MTQDFTNPVTVDPAHLQKMQSLNTIGTISYVLHLLVAVSAMVPGGQMGPLFLVVAWVLD